MSRHLFRSAREMSLPCSTNVFVDKTKIARKPGWALITRSCCVWSSSPYSLMTISWLFSSSNGFSRSRMEALHKFAFSKTAQSPSIIDLRSTESTHSNFDAFFWQIDKLALRWSSLGVCFLMNYSISLALLSRSRGLLIIRCSRSIIGAARSASFL